MSPFSRYLKALRTRRGLRQKELAHRLGYEPSYLSALERSQKGPPKREFIERLIRGLGLDEEEVAELHQAIQDSRRQIVLPARASDEEYALAKLLAPQLGQLQPMQVELIRLALCLPGTLSSSCCANATGDSRHSSRKEGRAM